MPEQFHFIQPLWLLALLPLALLLWGITRQGDSSNPWRKIVDPRLLPLLLRDAHPNRQHRVLWLLGGGWLLAVLALANPTWEQQAQPLMQTGTARVIVLDLSRSMLAQDLQPSRLVRARFKVEDILADDEEGRTGLVVFAGDAFSVTPLTRDADTLRAQLKALEPAIMPSQGSRADLGLLKAGELLQQAGLENGQVILVADGVEGDRAVHAASRLHQSGYRVSVLGVGTAVGAPLPDGRGGVTGDGSGKPLLVKLDSPALQAVAQAGGGRYSPLTGNKSDISYLLDAAIGGGTTRQAEAMQTVQWKEQGPLLAVLLLPLAALAFRRGWLLSVVLCSALFSQPRQAMALGWNDLWLRTDQQAAEALQQGRYEQAAALAEDPAQRGSAEYKKGDYQKALDAFTQAPGADAAYNRGNALARLGNYEQAIAAYDEALQAQPGMDDAAANKAAVEALLKAQQQQNQEDPSGQQGEQDQPADSDTPSSAQGDANEQQQDAQQDGKQSSGQQGEQNQSDTPSSARGGANEQQQANRQDGEDGEPSAQQQGPSEPGSADGSDGEQQGERTDNAFAEANRQLDEGKPDQPDDNVPDPATPPAANQAAVKQAGDDTPHADRGAPPAEAEALSSEEQLAAQRWLRRIADDPGGLLRRKFLYQYRQRGEQDTGGNGQDW